MTHHIDIAKTNAYLVGGDIAGLARFRDGKAREERVRRGCRRAA